MPDTTETRAYLTKAQLKTATLADSKEDNYGISNLRVTETETVVTDGHVLLVAKHRQPFTGLNPFSLSMADALTLAKAAVSPKWHEADGPYAKTAKVEIDLKATQANGLVRAIGSSVVEVPKAGLAAYPDYNRLMPTDAPDFTIGVNAKLLANLLLQVAQFADKREYAVKLHFRTERNRQGHGSRPIEIEAGTEGGEQVRALIMPIRI